MGRSMVRCRGTRRRGSTDPAQDSQEGCCLQFSGRGWGGDYPCQEHGDSADEEEFHRDTEDLILTRSYHEHEDLDCSLLFVELHRFSGAFAAFKADPGR